ncbi:helix-turn-helix domain-containing protein [Paraburkholderia sp. JHI869]|uniref:helix-turn-helix domain-containing protein n=1 Tax=Paraburkholderia sp. JHI869 TaxID=3112959 RepID=UPI0031822D30
MMNFLSHSIARGGPSGEVEVPDRRRKIIFLLSSGFCLPEVATLLEVFDAANRTSVSGGVCGTAPYYDVHLTSLGGGRLESSSAVSIWTAPLTHVHEIEPIYALFIAGSGNSALSGNEALLERIRFVGSCAENLIPMAESKVLLTIAGIAARPNQWSAGSRPDDGMTRRLDHASIEPFSGPIERALKLIQDGLGASSPRSIADIGVHGRKEAGLMSAVRERASENASERILASAQWMENNGSKSVSIADAAHIAAMSERNFLRRFKSEIGVTPSVYLMYSRLELCCQLLVETDLPVEKIARRCGFSGGGALSKHFRRHFSLTPTGYRESREIS